MLKHNYHISIYRLGHAFPVWNTFKFYKQLDKKKSCLQKVSKKTNQQECALNADTNIEVSTVSKIFLALSSKRRQLTLKQNDA